MLISCCVNTYKRPVLLRNLLTEIEKQTLLDDWELEIILVDNDPEILGKAIFEEFRNSTKFQMHYFEQPVKNISLTRNMGVRNAKGELILFIDDDGHPEEDWIVHMVNCLSKYDADGVFGTVLPNYEDGVPEWIKNGGFFERLIQETGERSIYKRTGNCLIKSEVINSIEGPFDPKDGLTGGEDASLFAKIEKNGAKLVFCKEGVVFDFVPKDRANIRWLSLRSFRAGKGFTKNKIKNAKNKFFNGIYYFTKSLIYLIISCILYVICFPLRIRRNQSLIKIASNLGHLAAFTKVEYKEYE